MNKHLLLSLAFCLLAITACQKNENDDTTSTTTGEVDENGNLTNHEEASDYIWDSTNVVSIQLSESSITVDKLGASVNASTVTISSPGTYKISGSLINGQILVNSENDGVVRLILNGVTIGNSTSAPIFVKKSEKTVIILANNTTNTVTDASTYVYASTDDNEPNAAIFSKSNLTIYGNGKLNVTGNFNDAIASKDGLVIKNATIDLTSVDDGIRGKDYLVINNANITANVKGDGLKSDNDKDTTRGYISVLDGTLNITSSKDAISAFTDVIIYKGTFNLTTGGGSSVQRNTEISSKGIKGLVSVLIDGGNFTINSSDDAIHTNNRLTINTGTIAISAGDDGLHADTKLTINDGDITISKSNEGIESALITINNGNISVTASDDGFNATMGLVAGGSESNDGSYLYIYGGTIYVNASGGDGLDSNGNIAISGGTIIVNGPQSQPEVGMDYNGICNITGGFLVVSGTNSNMTQGTSTSSSQYSLKLILTSSVAANALFHIQDADGNNIVTFKPVRSYYSIVFSSPNLKNGSTYHVYTGGSSTGTLTNGIYKDGVYTAGTEYTNFTISSIVTSIGSGATGPGGGGPGGGPGGMP